MTPTTFAEKVKGTKITPINTFDYPSEEQGIIFDHTDGCKIREYLLALHTLVGGPKNILAASRVSGGRVIVFLASKEIVDTFQSKYGGFNMNDKFVKTRKLKTPAIRVILSNVSPIIPNAVIENVLNSSLGLKPISPISILRVSPTDDIFSHVISWRRQIYLPANTDLTKIPPTITLIFAERSYRIFLSAGDFICFKCSGKGHKAENCSNNFQFIDEEVEDSTDTLIDFQSKQQPLNTDFPPLTQSQQNNAESLDHQNATDIIPAQKRGSSTIASSITSIPDYHTEENMLHSSDSDTTKPLESKNKRSKRLKPNPETFLKPLILTPAEIQSITNISNQIYQTKYPDCDFNAEKLIDFLPKIRGCSNKIELVKSFTKNVNHLQYILEEIKPKLQTGTKKTITSLCKALLKPTSQTDSYDSN